MFDDRIHIEFVSKWMERTATVSQHQLAEVFERTLAALWDRSCAALGDITVAAIVDRVFYNAREHYAMLALVKLGAKGCDFAELREQAGSLNDGELREAIQYVFVELLTVVGNLTAEILTPALHSELSKMTLKDSPSTPYGGETL